MAMEVTREGSSHYPVELVSSLRETWEKDTLVEYLHLGHWTPALVTDSISDGQMLTLVFTCNGVSLQHTVQRNSRHITHFGVHYSAGPMCGNDNESFLPPGFHTEASRSRPGQLAYADRSGLTCLRYGSLALAWKAYLERMRHMEALPTFADLSDPSSKRCFTWESATELEGDTASGKEDHAVLSSQVCFNDDVLTELLAAPSPDKMPTTVFEKFAHRARHEKTGMNEFSFEKLPDARDIIATHLDALPGRGTDTAINTTGCESKDEELVADWQKTRVMQRGWLPVPLNMIAEDEETKGNQHVAALDGALQTTSMLLHCTQREVLPCPVDVFAKGYDAKEKEHVAELEGALEASRDRVKQLEKLSKQFGEVTPTKAPDFGVPQPIKRQGVTSELSLNQVPVHVEVVPTQKSIATSTASNITHSESVLDQSTTSSEKEGNVFAVESGLLKEAHKISGLRRSVDALYVKSEDYERRLENLQHDIQECVSAGRGNESEPRYLDVHQQGEQKGSYSEQAGTSQSTPAFEERLQNLQRQVVACQGFAFTPEQPVDDASLPTVICEVKVVPAKHPPRAKSHVALPRARTPPRSPKVVRADDKSDTTSKRSPSPSSSVAGRTAPGSRGPPRRSISSVNSSSQGGSPPNGFRTPRSLSPSALAPPAKEGRGSSVSMSGSSVKSSLAGSISSLASVSSPDRCYKLCPQTLVKKTTTTYFAPVVRSTTPTRAHAIPQWCRVRTSTNDAAWRTSYQKAC